MQAHHDGPCVQQQCQSDVDSQACKQPALHDCEDWKRRRTTPGSCLKSAFTGVQELYLKLLGACTHAGWREQG